ncbi:hypothetical protein JRQ81_010171, partial [Phrynocephalus forsythii]
MRKKFKLTPQKQSIKGSNNDISNIKGSFTETLYHCDLYHTIFCQQCPSALYVEQIGQFLQKWTKGHKSDITNHNTQKPISNHFSLPGHSVE